MRDIFQRIWDMALPYQDKRNDKGHAEVTLYYAQMLLESEGGDEDIVIPAMILHDVGWSQIPQDEWMVVFNVNAKQEDKTPVQLKHQSAGVELARKILNEVGYPKEKTAEILEIISQHDTRKGFISKNEGLVRDADKLWRSSEIGFEAGNSKRNLSRTQNIKRLEAEITDLTVQHVLFSTTAERLQAKNIESLKKVT